MNRLWVQLTVAFGLVTIIGIAVAALLANNQVDTQFRRFVMHNQMAAFLEPDLVDYYARNGTWAGVDSIFGGRRGPGGMMMGPGRGMQHGAPGLILTDAAGQVVYSSGAGEPTQVSRQEIANALPLQWNQQTVGYLLTTGPGPAELTQPAQTFLTQTNRALFQAALLAGGLGVLVGVVIAWQLSAPLGRLAAAARQISQGRLDQRVPVKGANEVANLARAFNEMAASLQQAETLRQNLVADVAHELRTPISVIQGNLRAILDDVYPLEKAEIATIYNETLTLGRLVQDLRELTQAEAGQLSLNIQPAQLPPLIKNTVNLFAELAREKEIELGVNLPAELPPALIDTDRVRQILQNLLSNALRHTPGGGKITISAAATNSHIRVVIVDAGPGIPAQNLPHVFDRFWRADKSRSREQGGSGLGLAIAKQLVETQGGQIGVDSPTRPETGSRFWFTVPVASVAP